jgi:hypothetical protein
LHDLSDYSREADIENSKNQQQDDRMSNDKAMPTRQTSLSQPGHQGLESSSEDNSEKQNVDDRPEHVDQPESQNYRSDG